MPLRQTTGFVQSLLWLIGSDWPVPDFSTLCRRLKTPSVSLPYRGGTGPPNLLIDMTGIKAVGEGEWNARKHGGSKRRIWRKMHIGINDETPEVRAVEGRRANATRPREPANTSNVGAAPMLPKLLDQIPADQTIGSVTADGAYDKRRCHNAIAARNACAVTRPRKNAKPWNPTIAGAIARNETISASPYLSKAIWRRRRRYHRRDLVEAKVNCIKLLGKSLMARDFDRQVAEVQVRVAILNRYTALGIPITEAVG